MKPPSKKISVLIIVALLVISITGIRRYRSLNSKTVNVVNAGYTAPAPYGAGASYSSEIDSLTRLNRFTLATSTDSLTISEQAGRELVIGTSYLDQNGNLTSRALQGLSQLISNKVANSFTYKKYTSADLKIMTNPSKDEIKLYGTRFGALHINMLVAMKKHEKEITKDLSVLANIYDLQAVYLSTLNVPKSIASSHITILNNYSMTAAALRIIANPESDPVLLPYALQARAAAASSQGPSLQAIANFIKSNGIIYPLDEAGGYWNAFNVQK